ncbi:Ca2+-transporting ATPase [Ruminococcaceae bacterium FB2012]|nr:Ca2+-transporting ATPase [Ruminococcaceae bacterium FB2012]
MIGTLEKQEQAVYSEPVGLTAARAERLLNLNGPNRLGEGKRTSAVRIFAGQFHDVMVMILLIAVGISVAIGEYTDAIPILLIVVMNAVLGFVQEYRAERTLEKLAELTAPEAKVYRDGRLVSMPAERLVVGDVIELTAGDRVPADCIILGCKALSCDESLLTGETLPVDKRAYDSEPDINEPDKPFMVYMGTVCVRGTARAEVTAVGKNTQMGAVSELIGNAGDEQTPLQKRLGELGKVLALICVGVCVVVFAAGVLRGEPASEMLMTSISIAIAAIPEGLPAAVTIALALAVRRMLGRKALVNRLHAVETLGCASVICTDKTGTLTMNKMTVRKVCLFGTEDRVLSPEGDGFSDEAGGRLMVWEDESLRELLCCAAVCNNARLERAEPSAERDRGGAAGIRAVGDPTEAAVLTAAVNGGIDAESFRRFRIDEQPFDSEKKYMTVTVKNGEGVMREYKKGAPDVLTASAGYIMDPEGAALPLDRLRKEDISALCDRLASEGMRLLAFSVTEQGREVLLGIMAMTDPPRPEAKRAVAKCAAAGIRTVMITGDHKLTACAVAKEVGILNGSGRAYTGAELDKMSDEQLDAVLDDAAVFARVSPAHKLRIVRAYKARGKVVAMTGDGVNDAPAVKEASIGVSMGVSGTDVTKQAADCILLDDNFATLVSAVEEGRTIYGNIRKFVRYLISCNIGEVLTMLGGIIMGLPIVLIPAQILLVNLVTDGLPAVALGAQPTEENTMRRPPRRENESFFSGGLLWRMLLRGTMIGIATLAAFTMLLTLGSGLSAARTGAFVTLTAAQLIHAFECMSEERSLFGIRLTENSFMLISVILSFLCMLACIYIPVLAGVFALIPLSAVEWLISLGLAFALPVGAAVIKKF